VRRKNNHEKKGKINRDNDESDVNEFELAESRGEVVRKNYHGKKGKVAWLMRYVCDLWLAFFRVWSVRAFLFRASQGNEWKDVVVTKLTQCNLCVAACG
jgi:hypothetical protein